MLSALRRLLLKSPTLPYSAASPRQSEKLPAWLRAASKLLQIRTQDRLVLNDTDRPRLCLHEPLQLDELLPRVLRQGCKVKLRELQIYQLHMCEHGRSPAHGGIEEIESYSLQISASRPRRKALPQEAIAIAIQLNRRGDFGSLGSESEVWTMCWDSLVLKAFEERALPGLCDSGALRARASTLRCSASKPLCSSDTRSGTLPKTAHSARARQLVGPGAGHGPPGCEGTPPASGSGIAVLEFQQGSRTTNQKS